MQNSCLISIWSDGEKSLQVQRIDNNIDSKLLCGKIISLFDRAFGFVQCNTGESFFIHIANFIDRSEWETIKEGDVVYFEAGMRRFANKARPAVNIRTSL